MRFSVPWGCCYFFGYRFAAGNWVGVYLSEFGTGRFGGVVRFLVDTLTGIPSIVTGVFVYAIVVLPMKHFSAWAGGVALALIMVPIVARTTEEMIKLVPHSLREGALALGAPQWRVVARSRDSGCRVRHRDRRDARDCSCLWRNCAAVVYCVRESVFPLLP